MSELRMVSLYAAAEDLGGGFERAGFVPVLALTNTEQLAKSFSEAHANVPVLVSDFVLPKAAEVSAEIGKLDAVVCSIPPGGDDRLLGYTLEMIKSTNPRMFCIDNVTIDTRFDPAQIELIDGLLQSEGYSVGLWKFDSDEGKSRVCCVGVWGVVDISHPGLKVETLEESVAKNLLWCVECSDHHTPFADAWDSLLSVLEPHDVVKARDQFEDPSNIVSSLDDMRERTGRAGKGSLVDVFAGVGGLSLGFSKQGLRPVLALEIDKVAARVYAANNSGAVVLRGNVENFDPRELSEQLGSVDALVGGVPCEPFSQAHGGGNDKAQTYPRRHLVRYAVKMVKAFEPRVFCFENVEPAFKSPQWAKARKALEQLGYGVELWLLNAADFGTPQARKRGFLVGVRGGKPGAAPRATHEGRHVTVRQAIGKLPKPGGDDPLHQPGQLFTPRVAAALKTAEPGSSLAGHGDYKRYGTKIVPEDAPSFTIGCNNRNPIHYNKERYLTAREVSILQQFPPTYRWPCTAWQASFTMGGAVPPGLSGAVAKALLSGVKKRTEQLSSSTVAVLSAIAKLG